MIRSMRTPRLIRYDVVAGVAAASLSSCGSPTIPGPSETSVAISNGAFAYTFTLTPTTACLLGFGQDTPLAPKVPIYPRELVVDSTLAVNGNHLFFAMPQDSRDLPVRGGLSVEIIRNGNSISGT